jgi:hypothetical protein
MTSNKDITILNEAVDYALLRVGIQPKDYKNVRLSIDRSRYEVILQDDSIFYINRVGLLI